ncbi:hypothetical protein NBE98_15640 [Clostridium swellfunianum]|uniref:hypothetical protein n=1 Tax=Clostridium swellfunianum TaxID=1367462 RepID=UPI00202E6AA3|nr:hypothetical protein [Clostridium swellfunianum]MCM0649799.1 hypothetical protein [Clostridium swellfunianum]
MFYSYSKKMIKVFHFIRICFSRLLMISAAIIIGTALLSVYTFINFVNTMSRAYSGNPGAGTAILIVLIGVPTISYIFEKGLSSYLQRK